MNVGIRELKAHLSEYVHRAQAGEEIIVTERGKPVVRVTAYTHDDDIPEPIRRGIAEGWITPAKRRGPLLPVKPFITLPEGVTVQSLLDEDREDRF